MRLPKFSAVLAGATKTLLRFPLAILSAEIAAGAFLVIMDHEGPAMPTVLFPIIFSTVLGIAVMTAIAVAAEYRRWSKTTNILVTIGAIAGLVTYGTTVPHMMDGAPFFHAIRLQLLLLVAHALLVTLPFIGRKEQETKLTISEFWSFNIHLAGRVILGLLGSFALWAGLSLALAAIDNLFGVHVRPMRYAELWILVLGTFNTFFVLAGVPDKSSLTPLSVPKPLRMFSSFVTVPLVIVYTIILYAYFAKMLVTWQWLNGWVGPLVMGFTGVGILTLLMIDPLSRSNSPVWARKFSLGYLISLVPAGLLLLLAVNKRVDMYGYTEMRIAGLIVSVWAIALALYLLFSKSKYIILIPATLGAITLAFSFGPWSIFSISEHSQVGRLHTVLEEAGLFHGGKIARADSITNRGEDAKRVQDALFHIQALYGYQSIQPWFDFELATSTTGHQTSLPADEIVQIMGLRGTEPRLVNRDGTIRYSVDPSSSLTVTGFDRMTQLIEVNPDHPGVDRKLSTGNFSGSNADLSWYFCDGNGKMVVKEKGSSDSIIVSFAEFFSGFYRPDHWVAEVGVRRAADDLCYEVNGDLGRMRFCFSRLELPAGRVNGAEKRRDVEYQYAMSILYNLHNVGTGKK